MKTLLHLIKQSLVYRLCYRLVCWINYPTPRERMWHMFYLGKIQGKKEALKELPITQVQPRQRAQSEVLDHLPPGVWSQLWHQNHATFARPPVEHVPTKIDLLDDYPELRKLPRKDDEDTEESPAIMELRYPTRK